MADRDKKKVKRSSGDVPAGHREQRARTERTAGTGKRASSGIRPAQNKQVQDDQSEKRQTTRRYKSKYERSNASLNVILMGVLALIAVIAIIGGVIKQAKGGDGAHLTSADEDGTRIQEVAESIALNEAEIKTEITALIRQYRAALASGDVEALKTIFNTKDIKNDNTYIAMSTIITGYQNTEVWIRDGLDSASRVVFIYDDLTLAGFDTLIPNVSVVYVRAAADGSFFIDRGLYNEETMSFQFDRRVTDRIDTLKNDSEISELIRSTNQRFSECCETNPDFKAYIDMLNSTITAAAAELEEAKKNQPVTSESVVETEQMSETVVPESAESETMSVDAFESESDVAENEETDDQIE